jgi:hypothetical protein
MHMGRSNASSSLLYQFQIIKKNVLTEFSAIYYSFSKNRLNVKLLTFWLKNNIVL